MLHSGFSQETGLGEGDLMLVKYISGNYMLVKTQYVSEKFGEKGCGWKIFIDIHNVYYTYKA